MLGLMRLSPTYELYVPDNVEHFVSCFVAVPCSATKAPDKTILANILSMAISGGQK